MARTGAKEKDSAKSGASCRSMDVSIHIQSSKYGNKSHGSSKSKVKTSR